MIDIEYANAYSEVLEILKYIPIKDYNKIPKNIIELFEKNANNGIGPTNKEVLPNGTSIHTTYINLRLSL